MRSVTFRGLWLPKHGSSEAEWEDGFAFDEADGRAAVADGASTAVAAGRWAQQLVTGWLEDPFDLDGPEQFAPWLDRRQAAWEPPPAGAGDDWWGEVVRRQASWATIVLLQVTPHDGHWRVGVGAVGDSCVFLVRSDTRLAIWPIIGADDFGSHPDLIGTDPATAPRTVDSFTRCTFDAKSGDVLVMATDALAEWALKMEGAHPEVWAVLSRIDQDGLASLASDERNQGRLVNDDLTLVRCVLGSI